MIINRRTSFTDLEYPNPFEDPAWSSWDAIPNKTQVAQAAAGQKITYVVPDGAEGWYAMRVVPDGLDRIGKRYGAWGYAYLHEGSSVELWCNNGSTGPGRKSLGADGVAIGGAAGVLCGFKKIETISSANYGTYPTANPIKVVNTETTFTPWIITFSNGKKITRYTLGTEDWDATSSKNSALFILIDGKPCLSFENPASIMSATGATREKGVAETFDGVYLGTVPVEMNKSIFTAAAGLVCGQSATDNNGGGGALGSSATREGPTGAFGSNPDQTDGHGGSAFFDFTRNLAESNVRRFADTTTAIPSSGAWLYKTTEEGHDYSQPYGQIFTAPDTQVDATFEFFINGTQYQFPSTWVDANKQYAGMPYQTFLQGVHIGDIVQITASYADGTSRNSVYLISMHDIVYGLTLKSSNYYFYQAGEYPIALIPGYYEIEAVGAGGAGGGGGARSPGDYNSGAGGGGGSSGGITLIKDSSNNNIIYCNGGIGGGGGGAEAGHHTNGGGAGGGGLAGEYKKISLSVLTVFTGTAQVGDGGYAGKTSHDNWYHTASGGQRALYGLYAGGRGGYGRTNQTETNCGGGGGGGGGGYNNQDGGAGGQGGGYSTNDGLGSNSTAGGNGAGGGGGTNNFSWSSSSGTSYSHIYPSNGGPGGGRGGISPDDGNVRRGGGGGGGNFAFGGSGPGSGAYGGNGVNPNQSGQTGVAILGNISGSGGSGGNGGSSPTDGNRGYDGAIYIKQIGTIEPITEVINCGYIITTDPESIDDAGTITGTVSETDDAGAIIGTVSSSDDAGSILTPTVIDLIWDLGLVTDSVTETKELGDVISQTLS